MKEINRYINDLDIRLVFDDGKPGKVYALDPDKTSIYFIVDVEDGCLYINQEILNIHSEGDIKSLLVEIGVEMDIFPHFDDPSYIEDLKPSENYLLVLLMEKTTHIKINTVLHPERIFLFNDKSFIMECNMVYRYFEVSYSEIWRLLYRYIVDQIGVRRFAETSIINHFKLDYLVTFFNKGFGANIEHHFSKI
jgi:hypothetical protein